MLDERGMPMTTSTFWNKQNSVDSVEQGTSDEYSENGPLRRRVYHVSSETLASRGCELCGKDIGRTRDLKNQARWHMILSKEENTAECPSGRARKSGWPTWEFYWVTWPELEQAAKERNLALPDSRRQDHPWKDSHRRQDVVDSWREVIARYCNPLKDPVPGLMDPCNNALEPIPDGSGAETLPPDWGVVVERCCAEFDPLAPTDRDKRHDSGLRSPLHVCFSPDHMGAEKQQGSSAVASAQPRWALASA
jgi:hypothetical protein